MAQTKVVIIYSPNQNVRRTVIIPDDDSQIPIHTANIVKGEAVLVGSLSDYQTIGPDAMLVAHTGQQASNDRCAVVGNLGNIIAVVRGDPLIDTHPLGTLIAHSTAITGGTLINGIYTAPISVSVP